jgi:hypothetical protein
VQDLRNAVYTLCRDAEPGLLERISVEAMNVLRHRQKDESSQKSSGPEAASPLHSPRTSTQPEEPSGSQECDPGLSLLFLKSVAKALRASMQVGSAGPPVSTGSVCFCDSELLVEVKDAT